MPKESRKPAAARKTVGIRAYAIMRGVSHTAVLRAIQTGRISATRLGRLYFIDPVVANRQWAESTDTTKPKNSVNGNPKLKSAKQEPLNFNSARAKHETYKALRAKLEFEQMKGKLVSADDVRKRWFIVSRRVRDAIMSVPDRIAPVVTGMSDSAEVYRVIANELRSALEDLTGEPD